MRFTTVLPALALATVTLAACGSSGGDTGPTSASPSTDASGPWAVSNCAVIGPPTTDAGLPAGAVVEGEVATTVETSEAPTVAVLEGAVPMTSLSITDVVPGDGAEVEPGATVTVEYCGVGLASGALFDSSWARGQAASFPLAGVIAGWQEGIPGMKPGGRRLLVIPADLAYGDAPPPGSGIAPGESLIFVVDLVSSP
jgi:peptidylprolyl isomerase